MSEMEEKLNALLSNPQLMQQIASMAQAMGSQAPQQPPEQTPSAMPALDPRLLQTVAQTMGQTGIDSNQKSLLHALSPYLSTNRVQKLERAMQAARLAGAASAFLNAGGLQMLTGR
jgi:hypothetical protein